MILVPAIDILDGKAVRLTRGAFHESTVYDADPVEAAVRWEAGGAKALHVVDLDGARGGAPANLDAIRAIAQRVHVPFQVGGGVRSAEAMQQVVEAGASRVVLGTAALGDVDLLDAAVETLGDRLVVSVDVRDRRLATRGWTAELDIPLQTVIERLRERGVRRFVYSSIDRDGTLTGPDLEAARLVAQSVRGSFYYSGGVSTVDDLRALAGLRQVNLTGVIVGKALYERRFSVQEGQDALAQSADAGS
ncbi:MAG TPA: 1-(5-phosphoribosyl)-5-[(5-phosphoribosylamino)methylideneamino]imidazole-4-carboxamide isomerase [Solirubrobacteraceae bacterium]|jgi:phosphoribosylformimino-5-aminoimidazole carboxamide ribotide isomerase